MEGTMFRSNKIRMPFLTLEKDPKAAEVFLLKIKAEIFNLTCGGLEDEYVLASAEAKFQPDSLGIWLTPEGYACCFAFHNNGDITLTDRRGWAQRLKKKDVLFIGNIDFVLANPARFASYLAFAETEFGNGDI